MLNNIFAYLGTISHNIAQGYQLVSFVLIAFAKRFALPEASSAA
jgi:hypothetical protein